MKKVIGFLAMVAVVLVTAVSCNDKVDPAKEQRLKSYMLAGMYSLEGYGGVSEVEGYVAELGDNGKKELVENYMQFIALPNRDEDGAREGLKEWWGIGNKEELLANLETRKTQENEKNPHKAWDYARGVNNICMGHSAGYLTVEEADKFAAEFLVLAQNDFDTWEDYMADFIKGRAIWNPEDTKNLENYTTVTEEMFVNPKGIYKNVLLK